MLFWIVLLGSCALATIVSTILSKRPMVSAIGVSTLAGIVVALHDAHTSAFWGLAAVIVIICSLPVTVAGAIVTENLMDKYRPHWKD